MLFQNEGEAFNVSLVSCKVIRRLTNVLLGRTIPRNRITVHMGEFRHRTMHRPLGCRVSVVRLFHWLTRLLCLTEVKGDLDNRCIHRRRRCQGTADTNEELDLHHLLRSCRHLRRHYGHHLLVKAQPAHGH